MTILPFVIFKVNQGLGRYVIGKSAKRLHTDGKEMNLESSVDAMLKDVRKQLLHEIDI